MHTVGKSPHERLVDEHEGGKGSGTALFADVLDEQVFGPCTLKHVVFSLEVSLSELLLGG